MNKKRYESLEISVILFEVKDVIVASGTDSRTLFEGKNDLEINLAE